LWKIIQVVIKGPDNFVATRIVRSLGLGTSWVYKNVKTENK
jgi:hypothetical protein